MEGENEVIIFELYIKNHKKNYQLDLKKRLSCMSEKELIDELKLNEEWLKESEEDLKTKIEQKILKDIYLKSINILNNELEKRVLVNT
jgi:hypothetical protein